MSFSGSGDSGSGDGSNVVVPTNPIDNILSVKIQGQEVSFDNISELMSHFNITKEQLLDAEMTADNGISSEALIDLFPPEEVGLARHQGIKGADILYDPSVENNSYYWNEFNGVIGGTHALQDLSDGAKVMLQNQMTPSQLNIWVDSNIPESGPSGGDMIMGFNGVLMPRIRFQSSVGKGSDSPFFVPELDHNGDGVIDALDIMSYGKSLAISNGIDNPTNAEIIEAVNKTGSNAQIYVDMGLAGIYSNKTSPEQQQALLDSMPGFKEAWDRFNASGELTEFDKRFDLNKDGKIDNQDFLRFSGLGNPFDTNFDGVVDENDTGPPVDGLAFVSALLQQGGSGYISGQEGDPSYQPPKDPNTGLPIFRGSRFGIDQETRDRLNSASNFIGVQLSKGLNDDEIRKLMRDNGFNDNEILQAYSIYEQSASNGDANRYVNGQDTHKSIMLEGDSGKLKTPDQFFREKLNSIRDASKLPYTNIPFIVPQASIAPRPPKYTAADIADKYDLTDIGDGNYKQKDGVILSGEEMVRLYTPVDPSATRLKGIRTDLKGHLETLKTKDPETFPVTFPKDVFTEAKSQLSGKSRKDLDIIAKDLGIKGTSRLSDPALQFTIASRQSTTPEVVFNGPTPRESLIENSEVESGS